MKEKRIITNVVAPDKKRTVSDILKRLSDNNGSLFVEDKEKIRISVSVSIDVCINE